MIPKRYTIVRTSLGDLFITAERDRILSISTVRPHISSAMRNDTMPLLRESAMAVARYLSGKQTVLNASFPLKSLPFQREVFDAVLHIPYGQTATSHDIARAIGKPHAVRAVETICRTNPYYIVVPTHRVILSAPAATISKPIMTDEALRRMEKRHLDKARKRR